MIHQNVQSITFILICLIFSATVRAQETGTFTDSRDGKVYETVRIGDQWWMAENLAYKTEQGSTYYEDVENYVETYGYLYDWNTALKVCPDGWHLPSNQEYTILSNLYGGDFVSGGKLKVTGTDHWLTPNSGATNESGFSALPAGRGNDNPKMYIKVMTLFWMSDDEMKNETMARALFSTKEEFSLYLYKKSHLVSVRCIKN